MPIQSSEAGELIYAIEIPVVPFPHDGSGQAATPATPTTPTTVRYCDLCRRWGEKNSTPHLCWRNWQPRLSDLLMQLTRDGRRR
jgi:hypothetical protein